MSTRRPYVYRRRVAFYETDAMSVVHHSNFVRIFEDARVEWLRDRGLIELHHPYGPLVFAVSELSTLFLKPAKFDDEISVLMEARLIGARIEIRYAMWLTRLNAVAATALVTLVPVNSELRPTRLPLQAQEVFRSEPWSNVWPPEPAAFR